MLLLSDGERGREKRFNFSAYEPQKVLWRMKLKLLVEIKGKKKSGYKNSRKRRKLLSGPQMNMNYEHRSLFQSRHSTMMCFMQEQLFLLVGFCFSVFSNVMVRPRKFPGKSPASQCLQFVHSSLMLVDLERPFDLQEAVITKWVFLQWGDSMVPREMKGVAWEMGIWVLISVLPLPVWWH